MNRYAIIKRLAVISGAESKYYRQQSGALINPRAAVYRHMKKAFRGIPAARLALLLHFKKHDAAAGMLSSQQAEQLARQLNAPAVIPGKRNKKR